MELYANGKKVTGFVSGTFRVTPAQQDDPSPLPTFTNVRAWSISGSLSLSFDRAFGRRMVGRALMRQTRPLIVSRDQHCPN